MAMACVVSMEGAEGGEALLHPSRIASGAPGGYVRGGEEQPPHGTPKKKILFQREWMSFLHYHFRC